MVLSHAPGSINENAPSVVEKGISYGNETGDRSPLVNFIHNSSLSSHSSILFQTVYFGSFLRPASLVRHAIFAHNFGRTADSIVVAVCLVRRAGLVGDVVVEDPLEGILCVSSIAAASLVSAGDNDLRGQIDIGPNRLPLDLYPIGNGRGGGEGPATATVDGDMLVPLHCQIVDSAHIPPPKIGR